MTKKNITIDHPMKDLCPAVRVGCIQYQVKVEPKNEELWKYLKHTAYEEVYDLLDEYAMNEIPNVKESREAYRAFGKDPSRYRVSSEALLRRIEKGKGIYQVNSVVDVNNLISIQSGFSVGSYDTAHLGENLIFRLGQDGESYKGIGKEMVNIECLPVIADEAGAVGSSTSDSQRAMITLDTAEVLTLIYSFSENQDLEKAMEYGAQYLEKYAGATAVDTWIVD